VRHVSAGHYRVPRVVDGVIDLSIDPRARRRELTPSDGAQPLRFAKSESALRACRGTSPFSSRSGPRRRLRATEDKLPPSHSPGYRDLTQPRILPCDPNYLARLARRGKKLSERARAAKRAKAAAFRNAPARIQIASSLRFASAAAPD